MSNHYFSKEPEVASKPVTFESTYAGQRFRFITDAGVFSRGEMDKGTLTLLSALPENMAGSLLDLGCGWGAVGTILGKIHPALQVTMSDVNARAVELATQNAQAHGVKANVIQSDGFEGIEGEFDHILFNPPIRAGKQVVYHLFDECARHLKDNGLLYVVIRKQQGADSAQKYLQSLFASVTIAQRSAGYRVFLCSKERKEDV